MKEDRRREQLEREAQGRTVQPVVPAEELAARRRWEDDINVTGPIEVTADPGGGILEQDRHKRRRAELVSDEIAD